MLKNQQDRFPLNLVIKKMPFVKKVQMKIKIDCKGRVLLKKKC
jgi:hypothetical protein